MDDLVDKMETAILGRTITDDLVTRLKRYSPPEQANEVVRGVATDIQEAASAITALRARCAELEGALEPFAAFIDGNAARSLPDNFPISQGSSMAKKQITAGDLRRAARALSPEGE